MYDYITMCKQEDHRNVTKNCCLKELIYTNQSYFYIVLPQYFLLSLQKICTIKFIYIVIFTQYNKKLLK